MTTTGGANESTITVGEAEVQMFSGGTGPPLLFLHGAGGNSGWQSYHEELSQHYSVYAPSMPGFSGSQKQDWIYTVADMAHFNLEMVQHLGLDTYILMGSSMGGWIAAEMAAMCHHNLKGLVLIDPVGIRPSEGEIAEIFMASAQARQGLRFYDPSQVANYDEYTRELTPEERLVDHSNREMASQLCWKPYMYNPSLPHYLGKVDTSTLIVWGRQDAIVPLNCGERYNEALPNSTLAVIDECGHSPAIEKPQEFLSHVQGFLSGLQ